MAIQHITIQYSPDSGSTWYNIEEQYSVDSGSYNWTAPETESGNYLIRLYDSGALADGYDLGEAYDVSDTTFEVLGPIMATLEYSADNGSTWHEITSSLIVTEGTGSYTWYAPETTSAQYLVRISTSSYSDTSDSTFTVIVPFSMSGNIISASGYILPSVTLTYSNGVGIDFYDTLTGNYVSNLFTIPFTGTLTPTAANYIFNPVSRSYDAQISGATAQDFEAIFSQSVTPIYFISGSVMVSGTSTPISGAKVTFNVYLGSKQTIKYSDINGNYSASFNQNTSASYVATHPLYTILPTIKTVSSLTSNIYNEVFSGSIITYMVSGSIQSESGFLPDIEILCNGCTSSLFTDSNGQYSRSYATGSSVILTPSSSQYIFSPTNVVISNISASSNNNDFFATTFIPPGSGLSLYYDSRKLYHTESNIWPDLSIEIPDLDMTTYNTYYTENKDLLFGADWLGASSSSFYGIQVSSSFAIEFWVAPSTASYAKTLLSTENQDYPHVVGYITASKFVLEYKENINETNITTVKSYNIAESKYNHIVMFSSASYLYVWSNGMCYESASITQSNWNGAILGINREFNTSSYQGFIDTVKVWNGIQISLSDVNNYYVSRSYWKDLQPVEIPNQPAGNSIIYGTDNIVFENMSHIVGPSVPQLTGSQIFLYMSSSII